MEGLLHEARVNGDKIIRHFKLREARAKIANPGAAGSSAGSVVEGLQNVRKNIQNALSGAQVGGGGDQGDVNPRVASLEKENKEMKSELKKLRELFDKLTKQMSSLSTGSAAPAAKSAPAPAQNDDDDDDVDLFGSSDDEVDDAKEELKQQRLAAYAKKKEKKPALIAKSSILFDIKPWDDETDLKEMEKQVRSCEQDGLLWGAAKLIPVAFGVKKLQIMCVVEDDKVSIEELTEKIEQFEDYVQSVDIAAFNKI